MQRNMDYHIYFFHIFCCSCLMQAVPFVPLHSQIFLQSLKYYYIIYITSYKLLLYRYLNFIFNYALCGMFFGPEYLIVFREKINCNHLCFCSTPLNLLQNIWISSSVTGK